MIKDFNTFINENRETKDSFKNIWDKPGENLPSIFKKTIYRLPTDEELREFEKFDLDSRDVYFGFYYTIVGRGIKSFENKKLIIDSITSLCEMYPENKEYKDALTLAKNN